MVEDETGRLAPYEGKDAMSETQKTVEDSGFALRVELPMETR